MQGGLGGIAFALAYLAIRSCFPLSGQRRGLVTAAIFLAVASAPILEYGENQDYKRFGILGLNVCLFSLLPVLFGLAIPQVVDRVESRVPRTFPILSSPWKTALALPGTALILFMTFMVVLMAALFAEPLPLLYLLPLANVGIAWLERPNWHAIGRLIPALRYASLAAPCLIGVALTALTLNRLLTG
jgi:hypothetical protein